jgi:hypothetical protein
MNAHVFLKILVKAQGSDLWRKRLDRIIKRIRDDSCAHSNLMRDFTETLPELISTQHAHADTICVQITSIEALFKNGGTGHAYSCFLDSCFEAILSRPDKFCTFHTVTLQAILCRTHVHNRLQYGFMARKLKDAVSGNPALRGTPVGRHITRMLERIAAASRSTQLGNVVAFKCSGHKRSG